MLWKIYSWTELSPACSPTANSLSLAIVENEIGKRLFVRIKCDDKIMPHIGMMGILKHEQTEFGEITIFIPRI